MLKKLLRIIFAKTCKKTSCVREKKIKTNMQNVRPRLFFSSVIFILIAIYSCTAFTLQQDKTSFDYLLFVQSWPAAANCAPSPTGKCELADYVSYFVVHGLWPNRFDGSWPAYCNNTYTFTDEEITDIRPALIHFWPDFYYPSSSKFWRYEWRMLLYNYECCFVFFYRMRLTLIEKHGTCATTLKSLATPYLYLKQTLKLRLSVDLYTILLSQNIVPSTSQYYSLNDLNRAFLSTMGVLPIYNCTTLSNNYYSYTRARTVLNEIDFCIDSNTLSFMNCSEQVYAAQVNNCAAQEIWFLPIVAGKQQQQQQLLTMNPLFWTTVIFALLTFLFCFTSVIGLGACVKAKRDSKQNTTIDDGFMKFQ